MDPIDFAPKDRIGLLDEELEGRQILARSRLVHQYDDNELKKVHPFRSSRVYGHAIPAGGFEVNKIGEVACHFSVFCKRLIHGGEKVLLGTKFATFNGMDDYLLRKCAKILHAYAEQHHKHIWKNRFSLMHNMAHQCIRTFRHIKHHHLMQIIQAYASHFMQMCSKDDCREKLSSVLEQVCANENLETYDTWDRPILQFMYSNTKVFDAIHGALIDLEHHVVFLAWCSDWKNMRLLIEDESGPIKQLLENTEGYVKIWNSVYHFRGYDRHLFVKDLYSPHSQDMFALLSNSDCYKMILGSWFFPQDLRRRFMLVKDERLELTDHDVIKLHKDLRDFHKAWNQEEDEYHQISDSLNRTKKYNESNQSFAGRLFTVGGLAMQKDEHGNDMYYIFVPGKTKGSKKPNRNELLAIAQSKKEYSKRVTDGKQRANEKNHKAVERFMAEEKKKNTQRINCTTI